MNKYISIWEDIQRSNIEYNQSEMGITSTVYLIDDFVFKTKEIYSDLQSEFAVIDHLATSQANVPEAIYLSEEKQFAVFEKIQGTVLKKKNSIQKSIAEQIGTQLRRLHSEKFNTFGEFSAKDNTLIGSITTYPKFIELYLNSFNSMDNCPFLQEIFLECREFLETRQIETRPDARILHLDFHPGNIIQNKNKNLYIIDFEHSILGPPGMDIIQTYLFLLHQYSETVANYFLQSYNIQFREIPNSSICLGILHEIEILYWLNKNTDRTLTKRYNQLADFKQKHLLD